MTAETSQHSAYEPSQDERTLACVSHLTIFVSTIGLLFAIGLWIYLREKQPYATFQAAQAVVFQLIVNVLIFVVLFFMFVVFFGAFGIGMLSGTDSSEAAFGVFAMMLMFIFMGVMAIITVVMYAYAVYAAVRSYQGRPFRIPGIAAIANSISPMPPLQGQEHAS